MYTCVYIYIFNCGPERFIHVIWAFLFLWAYKTLIDDAAAGQQCLLTWLLVSAISKNTTRELSCWGD